MQAIRQSSTPVASRWEQPEYEKLEDIEALISMCGRMGKGGDGLELGGPRTAIAVKLIDLEAALRQLGLWSDEPPSREALSSEQPFAMDSLKFEEWLQFVFLPTIYDVLESGKALPERCAIAPMAQETVGRKALPNESLISTLRELDRLITDLE